MPEIIAVTMNKGGCGKTSVIANLGGALTRIHRKKVLIVDTDGQGNASIAFGMVQPNDLENTVYDVIMGKAKPEDVIWKVEDEEYRELLHILPANKDMNFLEFDILPNLHKFGGDPFRILKNSLGDFLNQYDYVLIDTPPSMGLVAGNVLALADKVIIPFAPETFGVNGLINVIEGVNDFKRDTNPDLKIAGVLGMMVNSRTWLHGELLQKARQYCESKNIKMFETVIPSSIRFANATAAEGKPATWTKERKRGGKEDVITAYFDLLNEVI